MANPNPSPEHQFKPGTSGNASGTNAMTRARRLLLDIKAEFPNPSGVEQALIEQVGGLLRQAARTSDPFHKVRCANNVDRLLHRVRLGRIQGRRPQRAHQLGDMVLR